MSVHISLFHIENPTSLVECQCQPYIKLPSKVKFKLDTIQFSSYYITDTISRKFYKNHIIRTKVISQSRAFKPLAVSNS